MKKALAPFVIAIAVGNAVSAVWYVDDTASGPVHDGTSWTTAYTDLTDALNLAVRGDQIWVAEGNYKPSTLLDINDTRSAVFQVPKGTKLYGGFDGTETTLESRVGLFSTTVLDGDLGISGIHTDDAYKIVYFDFGSNGVHSKDALSLDGFTVTNATERAVWMGQNTNFHITNCTIGPNSGNAIRTYFMKSSTLSDSRIADNNNGIIFTNASQLTIERCTFNNNTGRALTRLGSSPNQSNDLYIINSIFSNNSSIANGGAIFFNSAGDQDSELRVHNSLFFNNSASSGGAIAVSSSSHPHILGTRAYIINCTFSDNSATIDSGAISKADKSIVKIWNSIAWGNTAPANSQIHNTASVSYSDVEGGFTGTGNVNTDPLFVDPANHDYDIYFDSICVDSGSNYLVPLDVSDLDSDGITSEYIPFDIAERDRFANNPVTDTGAGFAPIVDMGAYEPPCVVDLDDNGVVDSVDLNLYIELFTAGDPAADLTHDGAVDAGDLSLFINLWMTGC